MFNLLKCLITFIFISFFVSSQAEETNLRLKDYKDLRIVNYGQELNLKEYRALQRRGDRTGNGGDLIALEFREIAYSVIELLALTDSNLAQRLKLALPDISIRSVEKLVLRGSAVSAINFPEENEILVSQIRWSGIAQIELKRKLVLHELLFMIGINDFNYKISMGYSFQFVCDFPPEIRLNLESSTKKRCENITRKDLELVEKLDINVDNSIYSWGNFNFNDFKNLNEIRLKSILTTVEDALYILRRLDKKIAKLDLSETAIRSKDISSIDHNLVRTRAQIIYYSFMTEDQIEPKSEVLLELALDLDNLIQYKKIEKFLKERTIKSINLKEYYMKASYHCAEKIVKYIGRNFSKTSVADSSVKPLLGIYDYQGWTPLLYAVLSPFPGKRCFNTIKYLTSRGVSVGIHNITQLSPIMLLPFRGWVPRHEKYFFERTNNLGAEEIFDLLWEVMIKSGKEIPYWESVYYRGSDAYKVSLLKSALYFAKIEDFKIIWMKTTEIYTSDSYLKSTGIEFIVEAKKQKVRDFDEKIKFLFSQLQRESP